MLTHNAAPKIQLPLAVQSFSRTVSKQSGVSASASSTMSKYREVRERATEPYREKRNKGKSSKEKSAQEIAEESLIDDEKVIEKLLSFGFTRREINKIDGLRKAIINPPGSEGSWGRPDFRRVKESLTELVSMFDKKGRNPDRKVSFATIEKIVWYAFRFPLITDSDLLTLVRTSAIHNDVSGTKRDSLVGNGLTFVTKTRTKKDDMKKARTMISIDAFLGMVPNIIERNELKRLFQKASHTEQGLHEIMLRIFKEFSNKSLWRPENPSVMDPEHASCLSEQIIVEIFEFLEVWMTKTDVKFLFQQIDVDKSGTIEREEWAQFFEKAYNRDQLKQRACLKDSYLRDVFMEFDVSKRGFLTMEDLTNIVNFINLRMSPSVVEQLFWRIDSSGDNKIQLEEFLLFFDAIQTETDMKQKLLDYNKQKERVVWFHMVYGFLFLVGFIVSAILQITPLLIITGSLLVCFTIMLVGIDKISKSVTVLRMNLCVVTVNRFRCYSAVFVVFFITLVIFYQFDKASAEAPRPGQQKGEPMIPDGVIDAAFTVTIILCSLNLLIWMENRFNCLAKLKDHLLLEMSLDARSDGGSPKNWIETREKNLRRNLRGGGGSPVRIEAPEGFNRKRANEYVKACQPPALSSGKMFKKRSPRPKRAQSHSPRHDATVDRPIFSRESRRPVSQGSNRPWSQGSHRIEVFKALSDEGAREQISRGAKSADAFGLSSIGIMKGLDN